jgi:hypothetical protein
MKVGDVSPRIMLAGDWGNWLDWMERQHVVMLVELARKAQIMTLSLS